MSTRIGAADPDAPTAPIACGALLDIASLWSGTAPTILEKRQIDTAPRRTDDEDAGSIRRRLAAMPQDALERHIAALQRAYVGGDGSTAAPLRLAMAEYAGRKTAALR